jgi:hypothetical protein
VSAAAFLHSRSATTWVAAGGLAAATLVAYTFSRTTGLPAASDDIGKWTERLGLASLFIEATVAVTAGYALLRRNRDARSYAG